jgi:trimeric autotransporter adhesin
MKHLLSLLAVTILCLSTLAQTPVPMGTLPGLTYAEHFDSIATWTSNFASGQGTAPFSSVAIGGTTIIPDPTRITTSSAAFVTGSAGGLQKDTANDRLKMLVTGTTNNTSSLAFDIFFDFTGKNAGTLSFDWATVFNGATTSNRTGTLKVFATPDGITFTEITAAEVTVTNYVSASGSVTSVAIPAALDNSPTARLRFYYYNSAGGNSGSRPLIALDNISVTAIGAPCSTPLSSPTSLAFTNASATSIQASFTPASPVADEYLVIATVNSSLTSNPVDSLTYNVGDVVGDGIVVYKGSGTSFTANTLSPLTTYTFFVFPCNIYCNGIAKYKTSNPLTGIAATTAGAPCTAPLAQPSVLSFNSVTPYSIQGTFLPASSASEYLVVSSTSPSLGAVPVDGVVYNIGDALGAGTVLYRGAATTFTAIGLSHSTTYYFYVFSLNGYACSNGPAYLAASPLTGSQSTAILLPCTTPTANASSLILHAGTDVITGFFNPSFGVPEYLVVMSTSSTLSGLPQDGTSYPVGTSLGGGTVISNGSNYSFSAGSLASSTAYYFYIISYSSACLGGPKYKIDSWLYGSKATTTTPSYNYYFGNLHSHSSFSDGNRDSSTLTPADDYEYAQNSLCMDFLGISDHNHYTSTDNPGMLLSEYQQGLQEANTYTASHPGFLALYGFEWGVISNGGHVLVYNVDSLFGWETLNGNPNYNTYVAKNDYLSTNGLFRKVNKFSNSSAFATLAHPSWYEFQNLVNVPYNLSADSAISGIAVESGPAFSTSTSYSDPASSMSFLPYYLQMLAKGYHVAPMIDHDNHNTSFGRTAKSRTAVLAPSISKTDFTNAVHGMHFYATESCDTRASLEIYGQIMGSIMSHSYPPAISVTVKDGNNPAVTPIIRLMYGVAGSGFPATPLFADTANTLSYTDHTLLNNRSAYYYADITIDNQRTITAPIWYTRADDPLSIDWNIKDQSDEGLRIINNPAKENLELELTAAQSTRAVVNIYNTYGQKLHTEKFAAYKGGNRFSIHLNMPAGVYIVQLVTPGRTFNKSFSHL